jgi:hypothetical protein
MEFLALVCKKDKKPGAILGALLKAPFNFIGEEMKFLIFRAPPRWLILLYP